MHNNVGIADKVRGGDGRQTIVAVEMRDNGDIEDGDAGKWIWRQRRRHGMSNIRDLGTTEIAVWGRRLIWA